MKHRCAQSVSIYKVLESHLASFCLNACVRAVLCVWTLKCAESLVFCSFWFRWGNFIKAWLACDTRKGLILRGIVRMRARTLFMFEFHPFRSHGSFFFPLLHPVIRFTCDALRVWDPNPTPAMSSVLRCLCIWLPCIYLWPSCHHYCKSGIENKAPPMFWITKPWKTNWTTETVWRWLLSVPEMGARFEHNVGVGGLLINVQWPLVLLHCGFDIYIYITTRQSISLQTINQS